MILTVLMWWLGSTVLGLIGWSALWRLMPRLRDRGYGMARAFGLLLGGYVSWLGGSLHLIPNNRGGVLGVTILLLVLAVSQFMRSRDEMLAWLRDNRRLVITSELIFAGAFLFWALIRAMTPDIVGTEKPMELAFINSILVSTDFPPPDPWLSGYAISYYYFGYVLLAFMIQLCGTTASVAFNVGNALWFALAVAGSYSLVYNLINHDTQTQRRYNLPLLGPLLTIIIGNLEGFLDVLHHNHFFWKMSTDGVLVSRFWSWLDIKQLLESPTTLPALIPDRYLWWWRASRVVNDVNLVGNQMEVIDEFPFFSFLLADNHPHVLAIPFVLLVLAFIFNILSSGMEKQLSGKPVSVWLRDVQARVSGEWVLLILGGGLIILACVNVLSGDMLIDSIRKSLGLFFSILFGGGLLGIILGVFSGKIERVISLDQILLAGLLFGSLAFFNTWDLPIYLFILGMALFFWNRNTQILRTLEQIFPTLLVVVCLAILMFFPWYPSFSSQAGGILPNLLFPTRIQQFIVMFGPLLLPLLIWLIHMNLPFKRKDLPRFILMALGIPIILWLLSLGLGWITQQVLVATPGELQRALDGLGADSLDELIQAIFIRRARHSWTALLLGGMLSAAVLSLLRLWRRDQKDAGGLTAPGHYFALFLIVVGALLTMGVEFVYLRDLFNTRMNTVFKFYYATWILWASAAAYACVDLFRSMKRQRIGLGIVLAIPILLGSIYPILSLWTKTNHFQPTNGLNLDGTAYLQYNPGEYEAIAWMQDNLEPAIVAEAVGGSYSQYGRVSAQTGFPTVLGWTFHEVQWRGSAETQGSRETDIRELYQSRDWQVSLEIIKRYQIHYIFLGDLERSKYPTVFTPKFDSNLDLIYQNATVTIYEVPGWEVP